MLERIPGPEELTALTGERKYRIFLELCSRIEGLYDMESGWDRGGKKWTYEYKYRRGGKTLCALYMKENCLGFMVIFGREERAKFEAERSEYSADIQRTYDEAQTYHDGKWIMFCPEDGSELGQYMKLLGIKRRPNRK